MLIGLIGLCVLRRPFAGKKKLFAGALIVGGLLVAFTTNGKNDQFLDVPIQKVSRSTWTTKNIEDITEDDWVLARDEFSEELEYKRVLRTFARSVDEHVVVEAQSRNEKFTIGTTTEHPFWVEGKGFVEAVKLLPGDKLIGPDGVRSRVVHIRYNETAVRVFNFEVEDFHTYFVRSRGSRAPPVLVHNPDDCGDAADASKKGYRAVSKDELRDIEETGGFRPRPDGHSMEDKWFSETLEGAESFKNDPRYPDLEDIVEAEVPRSVYDNSYQVPDIDGTGPGFVIPKDDLPKVTPRLPR